MTEVLLQPSRRRIKSTIRKKKNDSVEPINKGEMQSDDELVIKNLVDCTYYNGRPEIED